MCNQGANLTSGQSSAQSPSCVQCLENQLHEQYAINNNSNATTLIAILSALAIGFAGYGYVVCNYYPYTCEEQSLMMKLASIMVIELLVLLYVLTINFGTAQRQEQFITFSIRAKRYADSKDDYNEIFPENYHPFNKTYCNFVQGIYNTLSGVMMIGVVMVAITSLSICAPLQDCVLFNSCWSVSLAYMFLHRVRKYCSYQSREKKYREKLVKSTNPIIADVIGRPKECFLLNFIKKCCNNWESLVFPFIIMILSVVAFFILQKSYLENTSLTVLSIVMFFCSVYTILIINDKYN